MEPGCPTKDTGPEAAANDGLVFGLRLPHRSDPELRRLLAQHRPNVHGHRAWSSTWLLLDYLEHHAPQHGVRVLDAGCGWGLAAVSLARRYGAEAIAADIDAQVFPYVQLHARLNDTRVRTMAASFQDVPEAVLDQMDLLIGADICFGSAIVDPLFALISRALDRGVHRVVLADPGRRPFRQLASRCAQHLGAREEEWSIREPHIDWPGQSPLISGFVLSMTAHGEGI
jgi:predicted nicotinamide N-methyase